MNNADDTLRYYSINDVCQAIGLGRSRLYQLIGRAFPHPVYLLKNRRPVFTEAMFQTCLEVRRTNQGVDGEPVMFYAKRSPGRPRRSPAKSRASRSAAPKPHQELIESLSRLGMTDISAKDVDDALRDLSIERIDSNDGTAIARLFRFFKAQDRQDSGDKPG